MVCAVPHCGCETPPATTRCGAYFQSVGAERSKGQRRGPVCAPSLLLRPWVCCAHDSILRCDVDGGASACVVRRASLLHVFALLCVGKLWERMCAGSECGWLPASPCALGASIHVDLLDGVSQHPGRGEEEDGKGLLWTEGGWTGQSPSVSFPVLLAAHTESINLRNYRRKRLCRFVCATPSSSLHAVVTVRFGAVPSDEGRVRCRGRCAPRPFIASASAFLFLHLHIFLLLHDEFVGGALALAPCFMALCLLCRLRFFHAILKRLAAEDLDNVLCAALFSFVIAAAVRLCGCVLVARVASPAVAPLLCWWGVSERQRW
ncbi:hypothetical protein Tc00.1047053511843.35 [Trypanosoma cruzi]|uniref:Uncharacterized protein n=1 Tax=Trypanosoma cruzi (strain CL Brener) TaxID=353153 RepID=Q4DPT7_TRYCC|nr:hypothetical protein Tc00.1047053511843.35 [Trypanosoma cruzi]EAN94540.1 hypothetical protein Tc00.1047053511843.35 [Trypanosoma cruzi]|eukprot:XP_816391.1 hypothetical protein [Trypanosoma cruzi strain CL Brener]